MIGDPVVKYPDCPPSVPLNGPPPPPPPPSSSQLKCTKSPDCTLPPDHAGSCPRKAGNGQKPVILEKFNHYYRESPFRYLDIYRILQLYEVTDPCIQHAFKKLLVAGGRGSKDVAKDIQEVIDTLTRWQEMRREEDVIRGT